MRGLRHFWHSVRESLPKGFKKTDELESIISRINKVIFDVGYDEFCALMVSENEIYTKDVMIGSKDLINVIPLKFFPGVCMPCVLVMAKERSGQFSFKDVMKELRALLINCAKTQTVIILTDVWRPSLINSDKGDWRAHMNRGVHFIWILANDKKLTHLPCP